MQDTKDDDDLPSLLYPEHEKLRRVKNTSQEIGDFLEKMESEGIYLCKRYPHLNDHFYRVSTSINVLLADYFGIDLKKLEEEKRAMAKEINRVYR